MLLLTDVEITYFCPCIHKSIEEIIDVRGKCEKHPGLFQGICLHISNTHREAYLNMHCQQWRKDVELLLYAFCHDTSSQPSSNRWEDA